MSDFKYPGYTPMTDDELHEIWLDNGKSTKNARRAIEQAVLARLKPDAEPVAWIDEDGLLARLKPMTKAIPLYAHPPMNTAERDALVARIGDACSIPCELGSDHEKALYLLAEIRDYLVGGGK